MKNEAAPEELDDTLQLLFANADTNESVLTKTIGKVEDTQSLAAIDWDTDEEVLTKSSSANLAASSKLQGEPNTSRLNQSDASIKSTSSSNKSALKSSYPRPKLLPVSSGAYTEMGPFFGLTVRTKKFILKTKNIESLYDWQTECLNLRAIHNRDNLIYALPTSGGKTLVAEIAMLREVILRRKNVIFVLPYVSIVQEKIQDLTPFAMEFNFQLEDYCAGKGSIPPTRRRKKSTIYVCTIEKSQILYDSLLENKRLHEIGLIVVDELHMIGDEHRGYSLEILLTKVVYDEKAKIQIIGMSATISNLREVATALRADIYTRDFRPVELTEYVKIGPDILTIDPSSRYLSEAFKVKRSIGDDYTSQMLKRDPDHLSTLVLEIVPKSSVLIFCATKQNCESVATLLCDVMPREMKKFKYEEKVNLIDSIKADSSGRICPILARSIAYGVAYHHSGLTGDERKHLEEGYRLGIISVICCTSTLAAGVNLPAQRVIIRSPYIGPNFLTLTRYKQMVGRAGRAGKCETGESIIIFDPRDHDKLLDLLCSSMDETVSGFVKDESGGLLRTAVLNILTLKLATNIDELIQVMNRSLLRAQIRRLGCTLREKIVKTVKSLVDEGALSFESTTKRKCQRSFTVKTNTEEIDVYPDDNLEVSKLGKAAVNAGISLEDAQKVEQDLIKAGKNLNVIESLHMLYIVAPKDTVESINPDNLLFNDFIMRLNPDLMNIAKILGITESLAMRLITRPGSIKSCEKATLKRFYVALMLFDLFSNSRDVYEVAAKYKANRGLVHGLMNSAASRAYGILKFCEMYERFEMFKSILDTFTKRLAYCCSTELLPLMELPAVKIVRMLMRTSTNQFN